MNTCCCGLKKSWTFFKMEQLIFSAHCFYVARHFIRRNGFFNTNIIIGVWDADFMRATMGYLSYDNSSAHVIDDSELFLSGTYDYHIDTITLVLKIVR